MESFENEFINNWESETTMFFQNEDLNLHNSLNPEEALSGSYNSSSPDGTATSPPSKNAVFERKRRHKLNERLRSLRSAVPNISKLDKASILRDSISYIQDLQEQELTIQSEIRELETEIRNREILVEFRSQKIKQNNQDCVGSNLASSIDVLEVRCMGEKTAIVSITCGNNHKDAAVNLWEALESLRLQIITSDFTSFSGTLSSLLFLQVDEDEKERVKAKIETAIAAANESTNVQKH